MLFPAAPAAPPTVADALALGDCATALALLEIEEVDRPLEREARALAAGFCLVREGDPAAALEALPRGGELAGYAAVVGARALVDLGREDDALQLLEAADPPGDAGRQVRLVRGRILAALGDPRGKSDLQSLLDTPLGPQARFWQAEAHGIGGDVDAMVADLLAVWTDARPGGWDGRAARRLADLGVTVPDPDGPQGRDRAEARLAGLHKHRRTAEALELAKVLYAGAQPSDHAGFIELGHVYFAARDYEGALAAWGAALGAPAEASGTPEELFDYALCHARTDDYDTAAVVYTRLFEAHPDHRKADFGSFKLGYMKYDRRECDAAIALFAEHRDRYPNSRHLDEALWFGARCHWRQGRHDDAVALLKELQSARPRSSLVPGAAYWRARALGIAGDAAGEARALQALIGQWPVSGYAWFAAERLGRSFPARAEADPPPYPDAWATRPAVLRSNALLAVGLRAFALDELDTLGSPGSDRSAALALAWARLSAGDYTTGRELACRYADPVWTDGDPVAQQGCLPRPEHAIVEAHADPYGLDPAVAYGVMWAESLLQPSVTSAVGARGLMQLMPEVGATLHAELFPERVYDADDLYLGPYNAALGTTELGQRQRSLQGTLDPSAAPAVIASYNGGEEAVRRWLEGTDGPPDFDAWSEDVGYTETRRYIKRVLGHVMQYRWLYGDRG